MDDFTNQASVKYEGKTIYSNTVTGSLACAAGLNVRSVEGAYTPGSRVTYVISIQNPGSVTLTDVSVRDTLGAYEFTPEGSETPVILYPLDYADGTIAYYINGAAQSSPAVTAGDGLLITGITVPAGGSTILIYQAVTNEYTPHSPGAAVRSTVTLSGAGRCASAEITVPAAEEALLKVSKCLCPREITGCEELTYTFYLENEGNTASDDAVLTDVFYPVLHDITAEYNGVLLGSADYSYDEETGVFETSAGVLTVGAAVYTADPVTGRFESVPGSGVLTVTGRFCDAG